MAGDPHWDSVVLAMHMDGENGSTAFSNLKSGAVGFVGTPIISTARSKFGGASALLNTRNSYLTLPNNTDFDFPGPFTIDGWVYMSNYASVWSALISRYYDTTPAGYRIILNQAANGLWQFSFVGSDGTVRGVNGGGLVTGAWYHLEVGFDGITYYTFTNGVLNNTLVAPAPKAVGTLMTPLVGSTNTTAWFLEGNIDDLRITKGVCRHTSSFTPPVVAFSEYASYIAGTVKDAAGAFCARTVRGYRRNTGAFSGSTVSDAITGAFTLNVQAIDAHTVIVLDDDAGTAYNALVFDNVVPV